MPEAQGRTRPGTGILDRIVRTKHAEVEALRSREAELRDLSGDAPEPRDFRGSLADPAAVSLIAEVKRRSPGAGEIRPGLDPAALARDYRDSGAAALSVLTDRKYFGGTLEELGRIRKEVDLPLLRKDFVLDPLQVWEARAGGADAVLLIVRILEDGPLRELRLLAEELGMAALVEAHDGGEVDRALASGARILGVNNRDLATFASRLETTLELLDRVPGDVILVSESGIRNGDDVARLGAEGVDAVLVGEALLRASDPGEAARGMAGRPRAPRDGGAPSRADR